jgi:hypothetical protein
MSDNAKHPTSSQYLTRSNTVMASHAADLPPNQAQALL